MRLTFVLPGPGLDPVGGFKVVYEYAGGLSRRGHRVTVVHPAMLEARLPLSRRLRGELRYRVRRWTGRHGPGSWFPLDPAVRTLWVPSLASRHVPDADAVVATAWQTAEWVGDYPTAKGRKLYLVQSLETWSGPEERVIATWRLPMRKIVIARWLLDFAGTLGEEAVHIPNGLDFEAFGMDIPPEARDPRSVLMMFHPAPLKGSRDGLAALDRVREEFPDLVFHLFGVAERPRGIPPEFYHRNPRQSDLRRLYNEAAVFVAPSHLEGWPLPPAEAMLCGAAVAATDIGGHREYAIHETSALLSPPGRPDLLAESIRRLLRHRRLRVRLALAGREHVRQFTWERAVDRMDRVLRESEPA